MSILGIKSVPLERSTNESWKTVRGFYFIDRKRTADSIRDYIANRRYDGIINLGRVDVDFDSSLSRVWNAPETIKAISTPKALRRTLNDYIPPFDKTVRHWHKRAGFGGDGKYPCNGPCNVVDRGDVQVHIEGMEYRVVTVGDSVVQASRKSERRTAPNGRNRFLYEWIGVKAINKDGIIPLLKEAIDLIPGGDFSVFGWDIIQGEDGPFIIECNTAPGVNDATAARIVNKVREMS